MLERRTDLAMEAHQLWREKAGETTKLSGVSAREEELEGFPLNRVESLDQEGETALGKPRGTYLTLDVSALWRREEDVFLRAARAVAALLEPLLPEKGPVLAAGLGNPAMTADALGPRMLDHLLVTRHLQEVLPGFRSVASLGAGVLGSTGMEAAEWIRGATDHVKPAGVVVVDALAARSLDRLCSSIQISDTGLIPGSGVGNHRLALNREGLGMPVVSVGVPTVVEAATLAADLMGTDGLPDLGEGRDLLVTPKDIDSQVEDLSKVIGYGISMALQPGISLEELELLLS